VFRYQRYITAAALAVILSTSFAATAWSQTNVPPRLHTRITPQQKQASNQLISAAITQLSGAQSALGGGNAAGASAEVNVALSDLSQALPIYHGYRVKAMGASKRALRQLSHPKRAAMAQSSIALAISDANTALQNAGDEVNERQ